MALNQEGLLTRAEFDNGCFREGCVNDKGECYDRNVGKAHKGSDDIAYLLPTDPFDMDWLEDFEKDFGLATLGFNADEIEVSEVDGQLFEELNFVFTGTMSGCELFGVDFGEELNAEIVDFCYDKCPLDGEIVDFCYDQCPLDSEIVDFCYDKYPLDGEIVDFCYDKYPLDGEIVDFRYDKCPLDGEIVDFCYDKCLLDGEIVDFHYDKCPMNLDDAANIDRGGKNDNYDKDGGDPSDAMLLALRYLGFGDLLTVERVCKSLRDVVQGDPLLWRSIHIDHPFSTRITDDTLIKLTNRAQGHLYSLSLVHCSMITDAGLKHVVERNPNLRKLSVPGCVRLTIYGILSNLEVFKSAGKPGLNYLGIYGVSGLTYQLFEEFKLLMGMHNSKLPVTRKPRFFGGGKLCNNADDDCAMDVEVCPKCQKIELVYDCPSESCKKKIPLCRGCTICIIRCIGCGCCLNNCEYKELFSLDFLCLDCESQLFGCQEEQTMTVLPKTTILHKQSSYHFYLCG